VTNIFDDHRDGVRRISVMAINRRRRAASGRRGVKINRGDIDVDIVLITVRIINRQPVGQHVGKISSIAP